MSPGTVKRWRGCRSGTRGAGPDTADQSKGEPTALNGPEQGESDGWWLSLKTLR